MPPSVTGSASKMDSPGWRFWSLSLIVPLAVRACSAAPIALLNSTVKYSVCSAIWSSSTGTRIVFVSSPMPKVSIPLVVV